jgi:NAD(P)-dependent dehydrogenase (short-subunit alcohol dehydrogenase family)
MQVKDKVVVVTGAASGIGAAMARRFHAEGARGIVCADLNEVGAQAVATEVGGLGLGRDVADETEINRLVETAEREVGPIGLFCANAGIAVSGGLDTPLEEWQRCWQINTMHHVYAARAMVPRMIERGGGYIMNTVSAAGLLNQIGSATYAVTKHAAVGFAEWLSITHGADGIGVSILCPQAVNTPMIAGMQGGGVAGVDGIVEPEELAQTVVEGLAEERFLILPHPQVLEYMQRKTGDYDRWLGGMRRLKAKYGDDALNV